MNKVLIIIIYLLFGNYLIAQQSDIIFEKGLTFFDSEDYKKADSLILIAIGIDNRTKKPDYLKYYNCGAVKFEMNDYEVAIKYLDSSLMLKNDFYPSIDKKAWCKLGMSNYLEALKDIDLSISIAPKYIESYSFGAHVSLLAKDYVRSEKYCFEGLKIKQESRFYMFQTIAQIKNKRDYKLIYDILNKASLSFSKNDKFISEAWIYYSFAYKDGDLCKLIKEYELLNGKFESILNDERFDKRYKECVEKKTEIKKTH